MYAISFPYACKKILFIINYLFDNDEKHEGNLSYAV